MMRILDEYVEPSEKMVILSEIHNNFRNKFNENNRNIENDPFKGTSIEGKD